MSVGVAGGGSGCQWTVGRWIWGGQDQQQQQYSVIGGWLGQECEMNMQVEGRIGEDVNESSSGAFPYPTPTHATALYPCPELGTSQECCLGAAQPPALGSLRNSKTLARW